MSEPLSSRERTWLALHHREGDRVGMWDGFWSTTLARWRGEGMPHGVMPDELFGFDIVEIRPDTSLRLPRVVIEDADEYSIVRDQNGTTLKNWKTSTSTPGWLDHIIKTRVDWEEYRGRAQWNSDRVDYPAVEAKYCAARRRDKFIIYSGALSWDATLPLIGAETMLYAMVDDPAWVADMYQVMADLYLAGAEELLGAGYEFDGAWVYNDMAYRSGPFFSPRAYRELFLPHDRRVCDFFKARKIPVILHSCGNVTSLVPRLIEAGYACLQPLEVKAGVDMLALKRQYGDVLAFMGGIDVRAMDDPDPAAIELEISTKLPAMKAGGGYIYFSDHSVPDSVSFKQYCRVMDLVMQYGSY